MPHPSASWRDRAIEFRRGGGPADPDRFAALMRHPAFPRASEYEPTWVFSHHMGPNVVWLTDYPSQAISLEPGMRVLDMGCGAALSSIFLANEFGVEVWATDLWIAPTDNLARIRGAGLLDKVHPIHAEARAYPFQRDFFDAAVSVDSYHYWGCEPGYVDYLAGFIKPGGTLAIVVPGDAADDHPVGTFHSDRWWRRLWDQSHQLDVTSAEMLADGWDVWWQFCQASAAWAGESEPAGGDVPMLRAHPTLGFTRVVAQRL